MLFLLPFLSVACSTMAQVTPREQTTVEIRTETVYVQDTVYIELPRIVENIQTLDTVSVLENRYARSEAFVSAGVLNHSLETKTLREPVAVQKEIVFKDSIIVREVDVDHYIEVPSDLSGWQKCKLRIGGYALGLILILIVCTAIYIVSQLKSFKL